MAIVGFQDDTNPQEEFFTKVFDNLLREHEEKLKTVQDEVLRRLKEMLENVFEVELQKITNLLDKGEYISEPTTRSLRNEGIEVVTEVASDILQETLKSFSDL